MAIKKLDKSFAPVVKDIRYLAKTFPQYRTLLMDFAKVYFPNTYSDFNESSPGMMFIEMASYVGDVLSYYIDAQFRENLLPYAEEQDNIIAMAQAFGYKPKPSTAAFTDVDLYQLCPAKTVDRAFEPDERYFLRLDANTIVTATEFGNVNFRTHSEVMFSDPLDREITVYAVNGSNEPITYLVRKRVKVSSGDIRSYDVTLGDPERFTKLIVPDTNVLEILSVKDDNGFTWYEVDYLAQDLVLTPRDNTNPLSVNGQSLPPAYSMKISRTARRFVTRYDKNYNLELHFGSGVLDDTDALINLEPSKVASDEYQTNLASTALDPSDFLSSKSYGLSPGNVTLTIRYVKGGGIEANVPSNTITKISTVEVLNDRSVFAGSEQGLFDDIVASLAVNNPFPSTGGKDADTVEEIRLNAVAFFNSQNRLVNAADYMVRALAMPPKYGACAKVFVVQDEQINNILRATTQSAPLDGQFVDDRVGQNVVNFYVLGYDSAKRLTLLNTQVKENLRVYLDQYRILTDEIRILDAFVVNIGVNFKIVVFKNFNMNEVLARVIDEVRDFFAVDRWQINQPIIMADLYSTIAGVEGVQSVTTVEVVNKYAFRDGGDYNDYLYDIAAATSDGVVYPSLDPSIFEVRYPENDIVGSASQ